MPNTKLPEQPSLERLKKLAKSRLQEMRRSDPQAKLTTAQLDVAREYGFASWRKLKAQLDDRRAKKLTSPVMRTLPVTNLSRSIAFYREVLGFEIRKGMDAVEAVMGPAFIRFSQAGHEPADATTHNMPGSAVLFLESGDVEALHAAVQKRGGRASNIERVNWIKMRMFETRDPDGNVLWFGQSYHKYQDSPSRRDGQPQGLRQAAPQLPCSNVAAAVEWYRDVLGFRINYQQHDLGVMDRDAIEVLLIKRTEEYGGIGSCTVFVSDADAIYQELLAKGARTLGAPVSYPWGLRDFKVVDPEGNRIMFAQTFE